MLYPSLKPYSLITNLSGLKEKERGWQAEY
jgi:hypothetical protein